MSTINDLKLCQYVQGNEGEVLKVVLLVDHPESELLRRVGYKDMALTQRDVFTTFDLPRSNVVKLLRYIPKKVGRPANV
jgi:hypothetical protein